MQKKRTRTYGAGEPNNSSGLNRRELLKGAVGLGAIAALSGCLHVTNNAGGVTRKSAAGRNDQILRENEKPGTRDWLLTHTRIDPATKYRCPWVEGYCSRTSVRTSDELQFFVSTNPASPF